MLRRLRRFAPPAIRIQLTLWYTLVSTVLVLIFGIVFYSTSEQLLAKSFDITLQLRAQQVAEGVAFNGGRIEVEDVVNELPELDATAALVDTDTNSTIPDSSHHDGTDEPGENMFHPDNGTLVRILDAHGKVIYATATFKKLSVPIASIKEPLQGNPWQANIVSSDGQPIRLYSTMLTDRKSVVGVVQVGQSIEKLNENLLHILLGLLILIPFGLLLSAFGSYWLAGRAFRPIQRLARIAHEVNAKDLHQRVPLPRAKDEVRELSLIFNQMIERLEHAFAQQHRFVADASHELRTPVAVIRSMTELAISQPSNAEDNLLVLCEVNAEAERLGLLISDMLALARADEGQIQLDFESVRLDLLAADVVDSLGPLADEREVALRAGDLTPTTTLGDAARLIQIIMSLVDNALIYTNTGGTVTVSVWSSHTHAFVSVHDTGIGMAEKDLAHIFERFYRADPARSKAISGTGLGLAIVDWLVHAHKGSIAVESELGLGSTFTVTLPLASENPLKLENL